MCPVGCYDNDFLPSILKKYQFFILLFMVYVPLLPSTLRALPLGTARALGLVQALPPHKVYTYTKPSPSACPTPSPSQSCWWNLICPTTDHKTMFHMCYQRDLRHHPSLGAGVTHWTECQRALGPHRELHTRGIVHVPSLNLRIWSGQLSD